jgi:hypothetical protein
VNVNVVIGECYGFHSICFPAHIPLSLFTACSSPSIYFSFFQHCVTNGRHIYYYVDSHI